MTPIPLMMIGPLKEKINGPPIDSIKKLKISRRFYLKLVTMLLPTRRILLVFDKLKTNKSLKTL